MNKTSKRKKLDKLEIELAKLKAENSSKEITIKMLTSQVDSLTQKLHSVEKREKELSEKYQKSQSELERLNKLTSDMYEEYTILAKEKDSEAMQAEIDKNHMETKIRLLKEVLTKKNKDYQTAEDNNKELVAFIEK